MITVAGIEEMAEPVERTEGVGSPATETRARNPKKPIRRKHRSVVAEPDKQWFSDRLADKNANFRALADLLGINRAQMSRLMSGPRTADNVRGRSAKPEEVATLARYFGVTVAEIYMRLGLQAGHVPGIPLVGMMQEDGSLKRAVIPLEVPAILDLAATSFAVADNVPGSMSRGTVWYFANISDRTIEDEALGRLSLAQTDDGSEWLGFLFDRVQDDLYDICLVTSNARDEGQTYLYGVKVLSAVPSIGSRWLPHLPEMGSKPRPIPRRAGSA